MAGASSPVAHPTRTGAHAALVRILRRFPDELALVHCLCRIGAGTMGHETMLAKALAAPDFAPAGNFREEEDGQYLQRVTSGDGQLGFDHGVRIGGSRGEGCRHVVQLPGCRLVDDGTGRDCRTH